VVSAPKPLAVLEAPVVLAARAETPTPVLVRPVIVVFPAKPRNAF